MDTTTAAQTAGVTVDTIRHWARMGAVAATKAAGRWTIDEASLARRIALTPKKEREIVYSVETMTAIGGREWQRGDKHRVYFNEWTRFLGLKVRHYKSGNIASASLDGEGISNSQAYKLLGAVDKVWFDVTDGKIYVQVGGYTGREFDNEAEIRSAIARGIRSAIAAL